MILLSIKEEPRAFLVMDVGVSVAELVFKTLQHLQIHILHYLLLRLAASRVVVEAGGGVYLEYPELFWFFLKRAVYHNIRTTDTQAHVFGEPDSELFEFRVH